ncbi:MAG: protein kinase [Polyangiales bacterium]
MAAAEVINDVDRYEVLSTLGQGGFGSVYLARHRMTGREVALKVSNPQGDPELLARALNEARIAATIRHPSLVDVFDCGTLPDGRIFVAMERVEGRSLEAILDDERRLSTERAVALSAQVLSALEVVHARGIVHRDIKPSNLLVRREPDGSERVFIIDFGISKVSQSSPSIAQPGTMVGAILGTPGYMPPEQLDARTVDARADLYAVGAVLFRALSGRLPFEAQTLAEWFVAITQAPTPPLATVAPWVSAGVCAVVDRAIARDRDARPASAAVMRDWLLAAMSGAPGFSQPPQPPNTAKLPAYGTPPGHSATPAHGAHNPSHSHASYAPTAYAQSQPAPAVLARTSSPHSAPPVSMVAPAQHSGSYGANVAPAQPTRSTRAEGKPLDRRAVAITAGAAVFTTVALLAIARPWETEAPDDVTTVTNPSGAHPMVATNAMGAGQPAMPAQPVMPTQPAPAAQPTASAQPAPTAQPAQPSAPSNATQPANTSPTNGLLAALGAAPAQNAQETAGDTAILRSPSGRLRFTESRRVGDVDMSEAIGLVRRAMPSIESCHGGNGPARASVTMMFRATASPVFSQPSSVGGALARCVETAIETSNPQINRGTRSGGILADMTFEWR